MKLPVQTPFGNAFYLPRSYSAISNNPFSSYHIPVTLVPSSTYALSFATALRNSPGISRFRTLSIVTGVSPAGWPERNNPEPDTLAHSSQPDVAPA